MKRFAVAALAAGFISILSLSTLSNAQTKNGDLDAGKIFAGLTLRNIGPAVTSGRVTDFAVVPGQPHKYYVATASGGVWKTENNGQTWTPIFDKYGAYAIGVVTLDPKNPATVWVGTGENNSQRSVGYGDGIYKSIDGGKNFARMGLTKSEHIGRIAIDPLDSDVIYVAAQGPLWSPGGERGLYRSIDGGVSWNRILHVDEDTGVNDILINPDDPDMLLAASYQRRRHLWVLIDGGPGSGIHRSTDGGASWREVTEGLPKGDMGRIGLAAAPSEPNIIYAIIEGQDDEGGTYRSTDFGASWEKRSDYVSGSPQYYNELIVDPNNPDRVYSMDTFMQVSEDGGKTWSRVGVDYRHVDDHALWIDPNDTDHLLTGNDGGVYESHDRGQHWRHMRNLPITQFYRISPDNDYPFYNVYGGTQDNASLGAPSRTFNAGGIANEDWIITLGGDGFKSQVDPENPDIIYAQLQYGTLVRYDKTTGERVLITPQEGAGETAYKWNWNSALIISPHNNKRLYYAAEKIFRSDDGGESWVTISPDLTRGVDRNSLEVMGRVWSVDAVAKNRSTSMWGSIISLAESPLAEGLIYAGTDDGLIQVTADGGATWTRAGKIRGLADYIYVGDLLASMHDVDTLYATFDNHKAGDFAPYIYKSTNRGRTWTSIAGDLPARGTVHSIVEDHLDPNLLFVGTEFGLFFTQDGGDSWHQLKGGFPTIAVRDLEIQRRESDLTVASFGRGFWILDDYSALRTPAAEVAASEATLFGVKDALLYIENSRWTFGDRGFQGEDYYLAKNPPFGAVFTYYLKDGLKTAGEARRAREKKIQKEGGDNPYPSWEELIAEDREEDPAIIFTIRDEAGAVVRRLTGAKAPGLHRVAWDLRRAPAAPVRLTPEPVSVFGSPPQGPLVVPGIYTVTLSKRVKGQWTVLDPAQTFVVHMLDRGQFTTDDPAAYSADLIAIDNLYRAVQGAGRAVDELQERIDFLKKGLSELPAASEDQNARLRAAEAQLLDASVSLSGNPTLSAASHPQPVSISARVSAVIFSQYDTLANVTPNMRSSIAIASAGLVAVVDALQAVDAGLGGLEDELNADLPWTPGRIPDWPG